MRVPRKKVKTEKRKVHEGARWVSSPFSVIRGGASKETENEWPVRWEDCEMSAIPWVFVNIELKRRTCLKKQRVVNSAERPSSGDRLSEVGTEKCPLHLATWGRLVSLTTGFYGGGGTELSYK